MAGLVHDHQRPGRLDELSALLEGAGFSVASRFEQRFDGQ
jgi:hypothetical protein